MRLSKVILISVFSATTMMGQASAGPIMKMLEEKKASQAASTSKSSGSPSQAAPSPSAAAKGDSKFDTAKIKCKELGNQDGSDKFNRCVMTLME